MRGIKEKGERERARAAFFNCLSLPLSCVSVTYFKLIITGRVFINRTDIIILRIVRGFFNNNNK